MKTALKLTVLILCVAAGLGFAKLPAAENLMPADTFLLLSTENADQLKTDLKKSDTYKLFNDPAMKPFVDKFKSAVEDAKKSMKDLQMFDLDDPDNFPTGMAAFAVVAGESTSTGRDAGLLAVMEFGENLDNAKKLIDKAIEKAIEKGATRKKQNVMGIEVVTLITESAKTADNDEDGHSHTGKPSQVNYAFIDDVMVFSMDAKFDALAFLISQANGKESPNTLKANADYVTSMQATKIDNSIDLFINLKGIIETATKKDPTGKAATQMDMLGLNNISCFAMQLGTDNKTNNVMAKSLLKVNGEKKGLLKMLTLGNSGLKAPDFVDASTGSVSYINWDIKKAFGELANMLMAVQPQAAMFLNMPIPSADGSRMMTLQNDLLAHLGSQIVVTVSYDAENKQKPQSSVFALAVDNHTKLDETIGAIHNMYLAAGNPELKREFMGNNIYLIDTSAMGQMMMGAPAQMNNQNQPAAAQMPTFPKIGITVTDTHMVIAVEEDVEKVLRKISNKDAENIEDTKWYNIAKNSVPSTVGMAEFVNVKDNLKVLWNLLKSQGLAALNPVMAGEAEEFSKFVDFSLLPEFEEVEKYFGISSSYVKSRDDGFYHEYKVLDVPR